MAAILGLPDPTDIYKSELLSVTYRIVLSLKHTPTMITRHTSSTTEDEALVTLAALSLRLVTAHLRVGLST